MTLANNVIILSIIRGNVMCNMSFAMAFVDVIQLVFKKHFFKSECDYVIVHMCE